jgi:hypothetical protein
MTNNSMKSPDLQSEAAIAVHLLGDWFDPIEAGLRDRVREFIQTMIESELEAALSRPRYARRAKADAENADGPSAISGHRHGHRSRSLTGTFGRVEIALPRARLDTAKGKTTEWRSTALRAYQRRTKQADSLIAGAYLAGTSTRRVRRALSAVFGGAVGKDTVSRVWRKVNGDWDTWNARSLTEEPIVRLILDGTVVRVRLDRKATSIVLLVVLGVREDGQKVLLAVKNMGGETSQAWRVVLDDLVKRGLRKPEFLIVDGGSRLEQALAGLWDDVPTQRCTVHKHRKLLAQLPNACIVDFSRRATCGALRLRGWLYCLSAPNREMGRMDHHRQEPHPDPVQDHGDRRGGCGHEPVGVPGFRDWACPSFCNRSGSHRTLGRQSHGSRLKIWASVGDLFRVSAAGPCCRVSPTITDPFPPIAREEGSALVAVELARIRSLRKDRCTCCEAGDFSGQSGRSKYGWGDRRRPRGSVAR